MTRTKKITLIIIFLIVVSLILFVEIRAAIFTKKLNKSGITTICKIDSIETLPKTSNIYVSYYFKKKKYYSSESGSGKNLSQQDVGKFYEVRFLPNLPEITRIQISKPVFDKQKILKAGFLDKEVN